MKKLLILSMLSSAAFAADAPKPAPPSIDGAFEKLMKEVAHAQRDFLMSSQEIDKQQKIKAVAQNLMQAKYNEAGAMCKADHGKLFDPDQLACVPAPQEVNILNGEGKK